MNQPVLALGTWDVDKTGPKFGDGLWFGKKSEGNGYLQEKYY